MTSADTQDAERLGTGGFLTGMDRCLEKTWKVNDSCADEEDRTRFYSKRTEVIKIANLNEQHPKWQYKDLNEKHSLKKGISTFGMSPPNTYFEVGKKRKLEMSYPNRTKRNKLNFTGRSTLGIQEFEELENTGCDDLLEDEWVQRQLDKANTEIGDDEKQEINELISFFPEIKENYYLLGKIGEGTFSTVYKAIDLNHYAYNNEQWKPILYSKSTGLKQREARIVAIKKIYVTSSPKRIANEISILKDLSNCDKVVPIITALRKQDQVVIVLPYIKNDDFRSYYLDMNLEDIKYYFKSLFCALAYTHEHGIIHRDVKPSNFLYSVKKRHGVLVDFGLAEREHDQTATRAAYNRPPPNLNPATAARIYRSFDENGNPGIPRKDGRTSIRANRAGTRGFRAPEVLFKVTNQTVAIDIWSAGVILLCLLTKRFPFFQSTDDTEALLEISVLFGKIQMERLASELNRTFLTNVPTVKDKGIRFEALVKAYSQDAWTELDTTSIFDLLKKCLTLNPTRRISAADALLHPFLAS
ncbi:Cell cycle serine/threonine-protein kinase hsk1 [Zancudomyces culisetae]|uniref:non-specific serine/threonine protein kinase n=1 Tax=Zancudomyces culisetae TaxID=1213189 RepID=A0A1R1PY00_ZANCU|nr:Cell cycle serine/threonine-protein kinase hsk1 [Zancudomyces culisetae]|eukprot:OMH85797.1 Cell cycle serine/threonine-protein kinase hsk1 [Zancudomyces culisetae]